jgi:hypothetical protein
MERRKHDQEHPAGQPEKIEGRLGHFVFVASEVTLSLSLLPFPSKDAIPKEDYGI